MKQYICPHGERIVGSCDTILATADIEGFEDDGSPIYGGDTDVCWDTQETTKRNGKYLYICDGGEEHTLDECELKDGDEDEDEEE